MRLVGIILVLSVIVVTVLFGGLYYAYVTNTESPYDEIGILLNSYMPGPINEWGCGRLKETFGQTSLPPHGCQVEGQPTVWR